MAVVGPFCPPAPTGFASGPGLCLDGACAHYPGDVQLPPPLDKVAHASVFAVLAWALDLALWHSRPDLPMYRRHLLVFGIVAVFGATDEWHQAFVPGRACELSDWMADIGGEGWGCWREASTCFSRDTWRRCPGDAARRDAPIPPGT